MSTSLHSASGTRVESACRRGHEAQTGWFVCLYHNRAAMMLRLIEHEGCGCSTVRGGGGLKQGACSSLPLALGWRVLAAAATRHLQAGVFAFVLIDRALNLAAAPPCEAEADSRREWPGLDDCDRGGGGLRGAGDGVEGELAMVVSRRRAGGASRWLWREEARSGRSGGKSRWEGEPGPATCRCRPGPAVCSARCGTAPELAELVAMMGGVARIGYLPLLATGGLVATSDARCDTARAAIGWTDGGERCDGGCAKRERRGQRCHRGCEAAFGRSCVTTCECG